MNIKPMLPITALVIALLSACGGDAHVKVQGTTTVTKGQELTDLQRALNENAINQDEYTRLQKIILKRDN